jgi:hypothetical protein
MEKKSFQRLENLKMDNNLEFWMRGVLLSIIGVLGLIGNALFIYILWKKAKKSSIDFILIGMTLCADHVIWTGRRTKNFLLNVF